MSNGEHEIRTPKGLRIGNRSVVDGKNMLQIKRGGCEDYISAESLVERISFSSIQLLIITVLGTFFPLKRFSTVSTKSRPTVITRSLRLQLNLSNHIMASVMNLLLV